MAGRYGLNLRSIYDRDELTGGEQVQRGIAGAIAEKERETADDNARRAQGQVLTHQTGVMDRARGMGARVMGAARGIAGMISPEPTAPFVPPSPAAVNAGIAAGVTPPTQPAMNASAPGITPSYAQANTAQQQPLAPPPMSPAQHGLVGARPAGAPGIAGAIGGGVSPYDEQDNHGNTWSVDPLHAARVKDAGDHLGQEDEIAALTAAGMPAAEARARVLSNTVRYDQEFGQQFRSTTGLTFEQRKALQDQAIAGRAKIAALVRAGRTNSDEYRQESLKLRRQELALKENRAEASDEGAYVRTEQGAARIDYARGKAPDPLSASMETPEAKAAREKAARSGDAHAANVAKVQDRRKGANAPAGTPTFESAKAEEARLTKTGMTTAQARASMKAKGWPIK